VTTEKVSGVCVALGSTPPTEVDGPERVGRDASIVRSVKAPAIPYRAAPSQSTVSPLGCEQLGTRDSPCFHGGGLLPEGCDRKTVVLTPGLFAPKGKWAKRTLTIKEVLISKDCGRVAVQFLACGKVTNALLHNLLPGKCLIALANQYECNEGGYFFFRYPEENKFFKAVRQTHKTKFGGLEPSQL
jgi:hypothetical protein